MPFFFIFAYLSMDLTLNKAERIHKRDELKLLFREAQSFSIYPFKVLHYNVSPISTESPSLKFAISVPKRRFKKAVDRNLLKRRSREAFRQNRNPLKQQLLVADQHILVMLIYISDEAIKYNKIEEKIILILQRLQVIYAKDSQ